MMSEIYKINSVPMKPEFVLTRLTKWFKKLNLKVGELKGLIQEKVDKLYEWYNTSEAVHDIKVEDFILQHIIYYPCIDKVKVHKDKVVITYDDNIVNYFAATLILEVPEFIYSDIDKASLITSPSLYIMYVLHMNQLGVHKNQIISLEKFIALLYLMNYSMTDMETKLLSDNRLYIANDPKCELDKAEQYYNILLGELDSAIESRFNVYNISYGYFPGDSTDKVVECVIIKGE